MQESPSAERFVEELEKHRSPEQREKYERHFQTGEGHSVREAGGGGLRGVEVRVRVEPHDPEPPGGGPAPRVHS